MKANPKQLAFELMSPRVYLTTPLKRGRSRCPPMVVRMKDGARTVRIPVKL